MPAQASPYLTAPNFLDILIEDHRKILYLFEEFRSIRERADDETRQTLVEITCTELVIHTQIEEEYLYPALRDAFDDGFMVEEAMVEHALTKQLISELEAMQPDDDLYDAKFTVLGEYVRHHIEEEQNRLIPAIRSCGMDLTDLGADILERRETLRNEFGIPDEGYEEDGEDNGFQQHIWRFPHHH